MKIFLAMYMGSSSNASFEKWESLPSDEKLKKESEGMNAWSGWVAKYQNLIVDAGGPLSRTKRVSTTGISDIRNQLAAYTIIKANSHQEAAEMFRDHPHFKIFPGDGVEIMEILPIPSM